MKLSVSVAVALVICTAPLATRAEAQTTPTNPALTNLQQQQAAMDARLKIAQDQEALATAPFPASTTQPNSGAYTVSGSNPFPSQRLAYKDLIAVAATVATAVEAKLKKSESSNSVFIYDSTTISNVLDVIAAHRVLDVLDTQLKMLHKSFEKSLASQISSLLTPPQKPPRRIRERVFVIPLAVMAGLETASNLLGMFRTNTSITYSSFSPDNTALTAAVSTQLLSDKYHVYEPSLMPPNLLQVKHHKGTFHLLHQLSNLLTSVSKLQYTVAVDQAQLQLVSDALGAWITAKSADQANLELIAGEANAAKLRTLKKAQMGLDQAMAGARLYVMALLKWNPNTKLTMASASTLKAERDKVIKTLGILGSSITNVATSVGTAQSALLGLSNTGGAASSPLLSAESLLNLVRERHGVFLSLNDAALGGSVVTRVNLFTGGHLMYTGGAIASYMLLNLRGDVLASGVVNGKGGTEKAEF